MRLWASVKDNRPSWTARNVSKIVSSFDVARERWKDRVSDERLWRVEARVTVEQRRVLMVLSPSEMIQFHFGAMYPRLAHFQHQQERPRTH